MNETNYFFLTLKQNQPKQQRIRNVADEWSVLSGGLGIKSESDIMAKSFRGFC
jgi:hypothetical protein